ncbi:MAG TPA: sensor histidine kinase [Puia sp.]|jgi:signal transduction histidine kinase|nr:sensor histidine kinase [Puia sp.]
MPKYEANDKYYEVISVLITGTFMFVILTGIIVFVLLFYQKKRFQHRQQMADLQNTIQQELLKTQLETQENTFRQISEELHDNVGQLISSTRILLVITQRSIAQAPDALQTAIDTLATAIQDLRSLSKALNKEWLERFNLIDNLHHEVQRINLSGAVSVTVEATENDVPLQPDAQVMLFRIVQEALHNGIKHSEARCIAVNLSLEGSNIVIRVRDNGKGFNPDAALDSGVGLINMTHRTKLLRGTISWESAPATGTLVEICVPAQIQQT